MAFGVSCYASLPSWGTVRIDVCHVAPAPGHLQADAANGLTVAHDELDNVEKAAGLESCNTNELATQSHARTG